MLRIANWKKHFENNRTRELRKLDWVPIPNQMDGDGYTELLDHPDGAAHFGAWLAIVQIASKCDVRGTLSRDGARPHDARSLARISRISTEVFEVAIPRLISIGWLEQDCDEPEHIQQHASIPQDAAVISHFPATIPQDAASSRARGEGNGREWKGMEEEGTEAVSLPQTKPQSNFDIAEGFEALWNLYPVKRKQDAACQFYTSEILRSKDPDRLQREIIAGINRYLDSEAWRDRNTGELQTKFIPNLGTFLGFPSEGKQGGRMYLDYPEPWKPPVKSQPVSPGIAMLRRLAAGEPK